MKNLGRYVLILTAVLVLWNTVVIKPLKLFAVFLHELGHSLLAVIFGAGIQGFRVNLDESGYALVQTKGWFSTFMVANGGYLGSVLFALLILYVKRTRLKEYILGIAAVILLAVSIRFSGLSFTLLYAAIFAACVILVYMLRNEKLNDWVVDILGIAAVAYAVYDTFVDTILLQLNLTFHMIRGWRVEQPATDAAQLAQMTGIPAMVWGVIWLFIALAGIQAVLLRSKPAKGKK